MLCAFLCSFWLLRDVCARLLFWFCSLVAPLLCLFGFILFSPPQVEKDGVAAHKNPLLFGFAGAFEVNFGEFVCFVAAVVIFIFVAKLVFVFATIVAYHGIFGVGTDGIAAAL